MTVFLLVVLAGMWGIVFLPSLLHARQHASPVTSVSIFNKSLQALGSGQVTTGGRWVVMPPAPGPSSRQGARTSAAERRRKVFTFLIFFCAASLLLALVSAIRWVLWVHFAADVVLAVLVLLLLSMQGTSVPPVQRNPVAGARPGNRERYATSPVSRFEPSGHSYRMIPETLENPLVHAKGQADPPSIRVYREDDEPYVRLSRRPDLPPETAYSDSEAKPVIVHSNVRPAQKPRMFLDDEEDFLQAQGL